MKHIVGFSGGVDSQATMRWVLNRYPAEDVLALNTRAGRNEHPYTEEHISQYSLKIHPVIVVTPLVRDLWETEGHAETKGLDGETELTFETLAIWKHRFPSRKAQFCTEFLKLRPIRRWVRENVTGEFERYSGIRREESQPRKARQPREWDDFFDCWLNNPLVDFTKQMCFDYIQFHGEEVNPLYSLGFERVGCAPCINARKEDILNWALRFPAMLDKIRAWEQRVGRTFFAPLVPGMAINFIDDVIAWAKTSRGGRQAEFPILQERPTCESKYGLCE